jgi:hypothetical protein
MKNVPAPPQFRLIPFRFRPDYTQLFLSILPNFLPENLPEVSSTHSTPSFAVWAQNVSARSKTPIENETSDHRVAASGPVGAVPVDEQLM